MNNNINPSYYTKYSIQPINVIEDWNLSYSLGCVLKYICRFKDKGGIEDLNKAAWYLDREIRRLQDNERHVISLAEHK